MYWDVDELEYMQLDEFTSKREYYKVNCTQAIEKQDQDYFIVEAAVSKWPDKSVEY